MATKRSVFSRIEIGVPLISVSVAILAAGVGIAAIVSDYVDWPGRVLIILLAIVLVIVAFVVAARNGRVEKEARLRLQAEHPGALVERVRVWMLPHRKLEAETPMQFLIADAQEISLQTIEQEALLRIPVADLDFVDLVTAQGDRVKDKALTLIYGDDQSTVQLFTVTYDATERLNRRLRNAIGWPKTGTPADTA